MGYQLACMHIGASAIGVNPKINNMMVGYNAAKYEILWISDSGVMGECYSVTVFVM